MSCEHVFETEFMSDEGSVHTAEFISDEVIFTAQYDSVQSNEGGSKDAVLYVEQDLTDEQKNQARKNINVIGEAVGGTVQVPYSIDQQSLEYTWLDPVTALEGAEILNCYGGDRDGLDIPDCDKNVATGFMSQASGFRTQARGNYSQASGWWTIADGQCSHAEGLLSRTGGHFCHAEGTRTQANVNNAHSEGDMTKATGRQGHSEGASTTASGQNSHAEGYLSVSSNTASHAEGWGTLAKGQSQTAMGKFNIGDTSSRLIVGIGSSDTNRKNGFTVSSAGAGWFASTVSSTGADYAELFEWLDGNPDAEDRIGLAVTLEGEKIRMANADDDILGIISGTAMVLGDNAMWEWKDKYLTDNYGRIIYDEPVEEFVEYTDYVDPVDPSTWVKAKESAGYHAYPKMNPDYDPDAEYINRENRKEWDAVGLLGKIHANDDGTCEVGKYAKVSANGIVTASDDRTNMRVMKRITDNIVLLMVK